MQKRIPIVMLALVAGCLLAAGPVRSGVEGSAHDFRTELGIDEVCVVCHTPHNAVDPAAAGLEYAPLWSHESTGGVYTLYSSATLDHTPGQPDGSSKLCLSCHDGSIAVDNYGGTTTGTVYVSDAAFAGLPGSASGAALDFGTNLDNDHPISFDYDAVAALDPEVLPSTTVTPIGGTIASRLLVDGKVQCSSCHDVHDVDGNPSLLVITNEGSTLCLVCHDK